MTIRRKCVAGVLVVCVGWIVASAIWRLPPAGLFYIGQSLESCTAVLRQIDGMKQQYALEKGLHDGDTISPTDLQAHFGRIPKCPGGGTYTYNNVGVPPVCSFAGTSGLPPQKELVMYFFWKWKIPPSGRHEF